MASDGQALSDFAKELQEIESSIWEINRRKIGILLSSSSDAEMAQQLQEFRLMVREHRGRFRDSVDDPKIGEFLSILLFVYSELFPNELEEVLKESKHAGVLRGLREESS